MEVEVILKRFESPDEVREMALGRFELVHLGGMTLRAGILRARRVSRPRPFSK